MPERIDSKRQLIAAANATGLDFIIRDGLQDTEVEPERPQRFPHDSEPTQLARAVDHIRMWKQ